MPNFVVAPGAESTSRLPKHAAHCMDLRLRHLMLACAHVYNELPPRSTCNIETYFLMCESSRDVRRPWMNRWNLHEHRRRHELPASTAKEPPTCFTQIPLV